jgi:hypothetical protein
MLVMQTALLYLFEIFLQAKRRVKSDYAGMANNQPEHTGGLT